MASMYGRHFMLLAVNVGIGILKELAIHLDVNNLAPYSTPPFQICPRKASKRTQNSNLYVHFGQV